MSRCTKAFLTRGSAGSSLGCGDSSTPANFPVPYLRVLLDAALANESVLVEAVWGRVGATGDLGDGGGGMKLSGISSGRENSLSGSPCDWSMSFAALPGREPRRGDGNNTLGSEKDLVFGDASNTGGNGGSVFRTLTLNLGGDGKIFSMSDMSMVDAVDSGRDMAAHSDLFLRSSVLILTTSLKIQVVHPEDDQMNVWRRLRPVVQSLGQQVQDDDDAASTLHI